MTVSKRTKRRTPRVVLAELGQLQNVQRSAELLSQAASSLIEQCERSAHLVSHVEVLLRQVFAQTDQLMLCLDRHTEATQRRKATRRGQAQELPQAGDLREGIQENPADMIG